MKNSCTFASLFRKENSRNRELFERLSEADVTQLVE